MDYQDVLLRYLGRQVSITTFGYIKIWGEVAEVNSDHVRLLNTLLTTEHDDQSWYSQIQHSSEDHNYGPRNAETIVQFHQIVAISCQDDIEPGERNSHSDTRSGSEPIESTTSRSEPTRRIIVTSGPPECPPKPVETVAQDETDDLLDRSLAFDRLRVEIGLSLVKLASPDSGDLLRRITLVRAQVAGELGVTIPKVRVKDNPRLGPHAYRILLEDAPIASAELMPDRLLAIDSGQVTRAITGTPTYEPVYGLPGIWIPIGQREQAEMLGYLVCEPGAALAVHLQHVLKERAAEMFSLDDLRQLLTRLEKFAPASVSEAALRVPVPQLHVVLRRLLAEEVSIRNLPRILEGIALRACTPHETEDLVSAARIAVGRTLCHELCGEDGRLYVVTFDTLAKEYVETQLEQDCSPQVEWVGSLVTCLSRFFRETPERRRNLAILIDSEFRPVLWKLLHERMPRQVVLSRSEVPADIPLEIVRIIDVEDLGLQAGSLLDREEGVAASHQSHKPLHATSHPPADPHPPRQPR